MTMENPNDNNKRRNEYVPGQEPDFDENELLRQQPSTSLEEPVEQQSAYVENTTNVIHKEAPDQATLPVEDNYSKHEQHPGPSPEAVNEDNDKGAGQVMKWLIPILVLILLIYWFVVRK